MRSPDNNRRKKQKTNRYSGENMDSMFEKINNSTAADDKDDDDDDFVATAHSSSASSSESVERNTFNENGPSVSLNRQLARLEAKINQIQRASISNVTSSLMQSDRVDELPLQTEETLNKFETDLSQDAYRKKIVSKTIELYIIWCVKMKYQNACGNFSV